MNPEIQKFLNDSLVNFCSDGSRTMVEYLLSIKADLQYKKHRPLVTACREGKFDIARFLIEQGADLTRAIEPTYWYCIKKEEPTEDELKFLTELGAILIEPCTLMRVVTHGNVKMLKFLIENGADVQAKLSSLILTASREGKLAIVNYLLAEFKTDSKYYDLYLPYFCQHGWLSLVKKLINWKTDVCYKNNYPIVISCIHQQWNVANYLLSKGADIGRLSEYNKNYLKEYRAYKRWRLVHFRNWIRRVMIPLYFSPGFPGESLVKKELKGFIEDFYRRFLTKVFPNHLLNSF